MSRNNIELVQSYFDAIGRGDLDAVGRTMSPDLVWHQPGEGSLSGVHNGRDAVFGLLGAFMQRSGGTFRIDHVGPLLANGDLVAATLHFAAASGDKAMSMAGIDLLRIEAGQIAEVWLFSEDQAAEDAFWG